ncbi:hypothetical protein GEV43_12020 [Actinomadura sp. J1-007]|nr:hypothetical protein [Actinomadura sp. J1-007]
MVNGADLELVALVQVGERGAAPGGTQVEVVRADRQALADGGGRGPGERAAGVGRPGRADHQGGAEGGADRDGAADSRYGDGVSGHVLFLSGIRTGVGRTHPSAPRRAPVPSPPPEKCHEKQEGSDLQKQQFTGQFPNETK